jgi:hypothetical protein
VRDEQDETQSSAETDACRLAAKNDPHFVKVINAQQSE